MTNNIDFQASFDSVKSLMELQAQTISKSVELQKQSGEQLTAFFKQEAEKAQTLKSPEDLVKFNVEANTALFQLLKIQGEAFTSLATQAGESVMSQMTKVGK